MLQDARAVYGTGQGRRSGEFGPENY